MAKDDSTPLSTQSHHVHSQRFFTLFTEVVGRKMETCRLNKPAPCRPAQCRLTLVMVCSAHHTNPVQTPPLFFYPLSHKSMIITLNNSKSPYSSTAAGKFEGKSMSSLAQLSEVPLASVLASHFSIFSHHLLSPWTALSSGMGVRESLPNNPKQTWQIFQHRSH